MRTGLEIARGRIGVAASHQFSTQWATRVVGHLVRLPLAWFEARHAGDVLARFQSMQWIQTVVTGKLTEIVLDGAFATLTLIVLLIYDSRLAGIVVSVVAAYALIRVSTHHAFHRASDEAMTYESAAQSHFLESLRSIQSVKLVGMEAQRTAHWSNLMVKAANRRAVTQRLTIWFSAAYSMLFGLETVVVLGIGAFLTVQGQLTVGMLTAFIVYKNEFTGRMQRLIDNFMSLRMLELHVERLSDIVLSVPEITVGTMGDRAEALDWPKPSIELIGVNFRYGDGTAWVLRDVSMRIECGEHIAIVGPTGCGKTTLAKILLGLLRPTEGIVKVGGFSLHEVGLANWRAKAAAVMQDDVLFSGSIFDNISAFDGSPDRTHVEHVAKLVGIHDEIAAMPMGYHTLNGDMGSSLSGGQRQRLLLARALYRNPSVLILDEATSHLDVVREKQVNAAIQGLAITRITIAHRPETIAMAERIIDLQPMHDVKHIS